MMSYGCAATAASDCTDGLNAYGQAALVSVACRFRASRSAMPPSRPAHLDAAGRGGRARRLADTDGSPTAGIVSPCSAVLRPHPSSSTQGNAP